MVSGYHCKYQFSICSQNICWSNNTQNVRDGGWNIVGKQLISPKSFNSWAIIDFIADKLDIDQIRDWVWKLVSDFGWLGAQLALTLTSSPTIVQGTSHVNNALRHILIPQTGQKVVPLMLLWPTNHAWSSLEISTSNAWGKSPSDTSGPDTETEDEGDINMDRMDLEEEDEEEDRWMDFDIHSTSVSVSASSSPEQPKLINYHHITTITTDIIWPVMVMPIWLILQK